MKKKISATTLAIVLSSSAVVFAEDIAMYKHNNKELVPMNKLSKEIGAKLSKNKEIIKFKGNSSEMEINTKSPFVLVDGEYVSIETKEVNGYVVPTDTKIVEKNKEVYLPAEFLKDNKLGNYKIQKDKVIVGKVEVAQPEKEKEEEVVERPNNTNSSNSSSSSNNSNSNSNNNSNNNTTTKPSKPNTTTPNKPSNPKPPTTGGTTTPPSNGNDTSSGGSTNTKPEEVPSQPSNPSNPGNPGNEDSTQPSEPVDDNSSKEENLAE